MRTLTLAAATFLLCVGLSFSLAQEGEKKAEDTKEGAKPAPLGKSWKDQAQEAISKKNLSDGIYLYRKWLEADPKDNSSWYNLACAYSLSRLKKQANSALERAVEAGWDDWRHMSRDSDLNFIRKSVGYRALVEKLKKAQASDKGTSELHHVKFEATGLYSALLPTSYGENTEASEYPLILSLHGAGSTEIGHAKAFKKIMGADNAIIIAPRAPYATPNGNKLGYVAWIPESRGTEWGSEQSLRQWAAMIDSCVADAFERYRVKGKKIYVIGHSMGAGTSLVYTSLYPNRVASVFSYAGYGKPEIQTPEVLTKVKAAGVDVNICHCRGDAAVAFKYSEETAKTWLDAGIKVKTFWFDDETHSMIAPVRQEMQAWAKRTFQAKEE